MSKKISKKIIYTISSHRNISFNHQVFETNIWDDLGYTDDEWDALPNDEKEALIYDPALLNELLYENVEVYAEVVDEEDDE